MGLHIVALDPLQLPRIIHDLTHSLELEAGTIMMMVGTDADTSERLKRAHEIFETGSFDFLGELPAPDTMLAGAVIVMATTIDFETMMDTLDQMMKEPEENGG